MNDHVTLVRVLAIAAVERELAPLREILVRQPISGVTVEFVATGVGKVAAAVGAERSLSGTEVAAVVHVGCAGAYPDGKLSVGDVVVGASDVLVDEGVRTTTEFLPLASLGLPTITRGDVSLPDPVPLSTPQDPVEDHAEFDDEFTVVRGALATVSTGSGTDDLARELHRRSGALAESMEGAAIAAVAWSRGVPCFEIRGISNLCGHRDRAAWDIDRAVRNAARVAHRMLESLPSHS